MCCRCIILQHLTPMINPYQMVSLKDLHWRIILNISACISGVADIKLTHSSLLGVSNFLFISFRDQQYWKTWIEMVILYYVAITLDRIYTQNMWEFSQTLLITDLLYGVGIKFNSKWQYFCKNDLALVWEFHILQMLHDVHAGYQNGRK